MWACLAVISWVLARFHSHQGLTNVHLTAVIMSSLIGSNETDLWQVSNEDYKWRHRLICEDLKAQTSALGPICGDKLWLSCHKTLAVDYLCLQPEAFTLWRTVNHSKADDILMNTFSVVHVCVLLQYSINTHNEPLPFQFSVIHPEHESIHISYFIAALYHTRNE